MDMRLSRLLLPAFAILPLGLAFIGPSSRAVVPSAPPKFDGTLSVLTYNVHGLPWPLLWGRGAGLDQIAARLADMRQRGQQPHVVVLQEAFTAEARQIGHLAGYRFIADGSDAANVDAETASGPARAFAASARWLRGEALGKYVGSGLEILSDYPIVAVRRASFPTFACAGFDCLANKGALFASIRLPGERDPVDVVTTHLNSRVASGVSDVRSTPAYQMQVGALSRFIQASHDPTHPLIVAGDFNVGNADARKASLLQHVRTTWVRGGAIRDAYGEAVERRFPLSPDARFSMSRARDWQFFASGSGERIELRGIDTPFGHDRNGNMPSDHVGYTARFAISGGNG